MYFSFDFGWCSSHLGAGENTSRDKSEERQEYCLGVGEGGCFLGDKIC